MLASAVASALEVDVPRQRFMVDFDADVSALIGSGTLQALNLRTGQRVDLQSPAYDAATDVARWSIDGATPYLPNGNYELLVDPDATSPALSAEHRNQTFFLRGDFNRDRAVNFDDLLILAAYYNQTGKVYSQGDATYDGTVNFDDNLTLASVYGSTMTPAPTAATGLVADGAGTSATSLQWNYPYDATIAGFAVFRSTDGVSFTSVGDGTFEEGWVDVESTTPDGEPVYTSTQMLVGSYADESLIDGTKYWYRVRPFRMVDHDNNAGTPTVRELGLTTSKDWAVTTMNAPTDVAVDIAGNQATVTWRDQTTVEGAYRVKVVDSTTGGVSWHDVEAVPGSGNIGSIDIPGLVVGRSYQFSVTGTNSVHESAAVGDVSRSIGSGIQGVTVTQDDPAIATVSWTPLGTSGSMLIEASWDDGATWGKVDEVQDSAGTFTYRPGQQLSADPDNAAVLRLTRTDPEGVADPVETDAIPFVDTRPSFSSGYLPVENGTHEYFGGIEVQASGFSEDGFVESLGTAQWTISNIPAHAAFEASLESEINKREIEQINYPSYVWNVGDPMPYMSDATYEFHVGNRSAEFTTGSPWLTGWHVADSITIKVEQTEIYHNAGWAGNYGSTCTIEPFDVITEFSPAVWIDFGALWIEVSDNTAPEGDDWGQIEFTLRGDSPMSWSTIMEDREFSVEWSTINGTAKKGDDFVFPDGESALTFTAIDQKITVPVDYLADSQQEWNEWYKVKINDTPGLRFGTANYETKRETVMVVQNATGAQNRPVLVRASYEDQGVKRDVDEQTLYEKPQYLFQDKRTAAEVQSGQNAPIVPNPDQTVDVNGTPKRAWQWGKEENHSYPVSFLRNTDVNGSFEIQLSEPLVGDCKIYIQAGFPGAGGPGNNPGHNPDSVSIELTRKDFLKESFGLDVFGDKKKALVDMIKFGTIGVSVTITQLVEGKWVNTAGAASANRLYITGAAVESAFHTVLDIGCAGATGRSPAVLGDKSKIVNGVWEKFTGLQMSRVSDGVAMKYWGAPEAMAGRPANELTTSMGLLRHADAICTAWASLMVDALAAQGVSGGKKAVWPKDALLRQQGKLGPPNRPNGADSDAIWLAVMKPAQGNPNPRIAFPGHVVVIVDGIASVFDPSYGVVGVGANDSLDDAKDVYEALAISAFFYRYGFPNGTYEFSSNLYGPVAGEVETNYYEYPD